MTRPSRVVFHSESRVTTSACTMTSAAATISLKLIGKAGERGQQRGDRQREDCRLCHSRRSELCHLGSESIKLSPVDLDDAIGSFEKPCVLSEAVFDASSYTDRSGCRARPVWPRPSGCPDGDPQLNWFCQVQGGPSGSRRCRRRAPDVVLGRRVMTPIPPR